MTASAGFKQPYGCGASVEIPGIPLPIVDPLIRATVERNEHGDAHLQLRPTVKKRGPVPVTYVGTIAIPYYSADGSIDVALLDVPAPAPWTEADVETAREAAAALGLHRAGAAPLTVPDSTTASEASREHLDWSEARRAAAACSRLLAHWPTSRTTAVEWHPVERARGRELERVTLRANESRTRPIRTGSGRVVPSRSARRVLDQTRVLNRALATAAQTLMSLVDQALDYEVHAPLRSQFRSIERVAVLSLPPASHTDPTPSSWPPVVLDAYAAVSRALSHLVRQRAGEDHAPLADLWWLYESWVTFRVKEELERTLGKPVATPNDGSLVAAWEVTGERVELHRQIPIGRKKHAVNGDELVSATYDLQPDLLLSVRRRRTAHVVADPKHHVELARTVAGPDASKYLWGIRSHFSPAAPAVEHVALVSPRGGPAPHNPGTSRMECVAAFPNRGSEPDEAGLLDALGPATAAWLTTARRAADDTAADSV